MTITLEDARPADAAILHRIAEAAYARYLPRMGRRPAPMDDDFATLIAAGHVRVARLAEETGSARILGYAVSWMEAGASVPGAGPVWHLSNVAVSPDAAGRGVGRALIDDVEARARVSGARAVDLYTHVTMTENRALYPRLGYRETGERVEDGFHRVYFSKAL